MVSLNGSRVILSASGCTSTASVAPGWAPMAFTAMGRSLITSTALRWMLHSSRETSSAQSGHPWLQRELHRQYWTSMASIWLFNSFRWEPHYCQLSAFMGFGWSSIIKDKAPRPKISLRATIVQQPWHKKYQEEQEAIGINNINFRTCRRLFVNYFVEIILVLIFCEFLCWFTGWPHDSFWSIVPVPILFNFLSEKTFLKGTVSWDI